MSFARFLVSYLLCFAFYNAAFTWVLYPLIAFLAALCGLTAGVAVLQFVAAVAFIWYTAKYVDAVIRQITAMLFESNSPA